MKAALLIGLVFAASPAGAQPSRTTAATEEQMRLRYQVGVMERVLEEAVQHGAQITGLQMQSMTPSNWLFTAAPARARGFKLEGYGVFFDVEVPALRRSATWSIRELAQQDLAVAKALTSLRQHLETLPDRPSRTSLEQALRRIELQVGVPTLGAGDSSLTAPIPADDPGSAYTSQVKAALIDAMLDHSGPIAIGSDEWLTIAARDNEERLSRSDMYDVVTIVLRIRGSDLAAFRGDRLTRDEARSRVEVREF